MLMAGVYKVVVRDHYLGKSKDKGTPFIAIEFEEDNDIEPQSITWFGYITDKTVERVVKTIEELGWTGDDILQLDHPRKEENEGDSRFDLRGKKCEIVVESEEYNGKTYHKVKWINVGKNGSTLGNALDANEAKSISRLVKAHIGKRPAEADKIPF